MEKAERASSDPDTSEPESEPGAEGPRGCAPIPMRRRADAARKETAGKGGPERPGGGRLARVKAGFERRRDAAKERLGRMRERIGNVKQAASQKISQGFTRMRERRAKARERKKCVVAAARACARLQTAVAHEPQRMHKQQQAPDNRNGRRGAQAGGVQGAHREGGS